MFTFDLGALKLKYLIVPNILRLYFYLSLVATEQSPTSILVHSPPPSLGSLLHGGSDESGIWLRPGTQHSTRLSKDLPVLVLTSFPRQTLEAWICIYSMVFDRRALGYFDPPGVHCVWSEGGPS